MARLGRRQPASTKLRQPVVVGTATVFRQIQLWLAAVGRPQQIVGPRRPHPTLRPPTVVGAPTTFRASQSKLVQQPRRYQHAASKIAPPSTVGAAVVFRPVAVKTVVQPRRFQHAQSRKLVPVVVSPPVVFRSWDSTLVPPPSRYLRHTRSFRGIPVLTTSTPVITFTPQRTLMGVGT